MTDEISYSIRKSKRARQVRVTVYRDGSVVVVVPWWAALSVARASIESKKEWIRDKIKRFAENPSKSNRIFSKKDYLGHKERARVLVAERIAFYNRIYGFTFGRISIKNQKTRWGSCSSKKNLSFNYKILFLSEKERDYIIVHELCHLAELNHSKDFWALVSRTFPDYREVRRGLGEGIR